MNITGTGITPFTAKISTGWKPDTKLALKWTRKTDDNYFAVDRGQSGDVYESTIRIYGKETASGVFQGVNDFLDELEANRQAGSNQITMANFADPSEHIFGENLDYSGSLNVAILDIGEREQISLKGWAVKLKVRCLSPTFTGSPALPSLQYLDIGYKADSVITLTKHDTYNGSFSYADMDADYGVFKGNFLFSLANMKAIRQYLRMTNAQGGKRGETISISAINGVSYPFGNRRASGYPYNVKIIDFEDMGLWGLHNYRAKITMAEVI